MFEVKKYRVIYYDNCYHVEGYKFGQWCSCLIHSGNGCWRYLKCFGEGDKKNKEKALKYAQEMNDGKMGLDYYTDSYKKYYRTEVIEI